MIWRRQLRWGWFWWFCDWALVLGVVVLLFGRSLFWAFIAIAGFLLGMALAHEWLADKPEWIQLLAAIGAGVLGAILGILIERLAFAIAGFFAGGYLAIALAAHLHAGGNSHIFWIVGGVIGAIGTAAGWSSSPLAMNIPGTAYSCPPRREKCSCQRSSSRGIV